MPNPLAPEWLDASVDANALVPGIWAQGVERDGSGQVTVQGISVSDLAHRFGTPLYVMDEDHARTQAIRVRQAFDAATAAAATSAKVYYASKAFLCTSVARLVADAGLLIDVASGCLLYTSDAADE